MERRLHLVQARIDEDTIAVLSQLLTEARAGRIIGLAYVALHAAHQYSGDLVGVATTNPLLARGICRALEDQIASKPSDGRR